MGIRMFSKSAVSELKLCWDSLVFPYAHTHNGNHNGDDDSRDQDGNQDYPLGCCKKQQRHFNEKPPCYTLTARIEQKQQQHKQLTAG